MSKAIKKTKNTHNKKVLPIAIQGFEGSFHQVAAKEFYGSKVKILPCVTFSELITHASNAKKTNGGIMAIENSIAGSILPNYNLLQKSSLYVLGEVYLQIDQHLMVNPGVKLKDITEVHSHPMALQQCLGFLNKHPWKLIETEDTALSAKKIHSKKSKHIAAIASKLAAEMFELNIIVSKINDVKDNYTRFLVLGQDKVVVEGANKASINFVTNHMMGSLAKVLTAIASQGVNLSKLQSFPLAGSQFKYGFHADMEFENADQLKLALKEIKALTKEIRILGVYKKGKFNA